jgi:predicted MFS family arabinose efflux permease
MWSRDLVLVLAAVGCLFLNYPVLLVVGPLAYQAAGGNAGQAGLVTALFSTATVATELVSPALLTRVAPHRVLVAALALMSLGTLASSMVVDNAAALLALAPVRGSAFGAAVVAMSVLVTELAPVGRRGAALGVLGLTTSIPSVFGPAVGLALLSAFGAAEVFVLTGLAALIGVCLAWAAHPPEVAGIARNPSVWQGLNRRDMLAPFVALVLISAGYGGFVSYAALVLPVPAGIATALFLAYGVTRALARWAAGSGSDRFGARLLALVGVGTALVALLALAGTSAALLLIAAGALFGAGQGLAQGALQVGMLDHPDPADVRLGSTLWNLGVDAGIIVGGAGLALVAAGDDLSSILRTLPLFAAASLAVLALSWAPAIQLGTTRRASNSDRARIPGAPDSHGSRNQSR